jgi:hypothetical protein
MIYVVFKLNGIGKIIGMHSFRSYEDAKAYASFLRRRSQDDSRVVIEESQFDE